MLLQGALCCSEGLTCQVSVAVREYIISQRWKNNLDVGNFKFERRYRKKQRLVLAILAGPRCLIGALDVMISFHLRLHFTNKVFLTMEMTSKVFDDLDMSGQLARADSVYQLRWSSLSTFTPDRREQRDSSANCVVNFTPRWMLLGMSNIVGRSLCVSLLVM